MKLRSWVIAALVVGGVVIVYRGCANRAAPDERLAEHFDEMCDIARGGIDKPAKGVRKLGRYAAKHLDDMLGSFGATIATIERIDDDDRHDDRAGLAHERLAGPLIACARDWERFADAVESDPEANELVLRAMERLNRTLDILLSGRRLDWRLLPAQLRGVFEQRVR